jgi:FlaA1/EpsC-like NDP-sugar epimerase
MKNLNEMPPKQKRWINLALLLFLFIIIFYVLSAIKRDLFYYPIVVINSEKLTTSVISEPRSSSEACESFLQMQLHNIHVACPSCSTNASKCSSDLTTTQKLLVSNAVLEHYSARLLNAYSLYESPSSLIAHQACIQSEQQALNKNLWGRCYAPYETRSSPKSKQLYSQWPNEDSWGVLIIMAAIFSCAFFAIGFSREIALSAVALTRRQKQLLLFLIDIIVLETCLYLSFALKLETLQVSQNNLTYILAISPFLAGPIFWKLGLYNDIVRYIGLQSITRIAQAVALYILVLCVCITLIDPHNPSAYSLALIHGLLALLLIGASRSIGGKWLSQAAIQGASHEPRKRALIYGAGLAGVQLAMALSQSREILPVAFIDDDEKLHGKNIAGLTVYSRKSLRRLVKNKKISEVLLAIPSSNRTTKNNIISELEKLPVLVRILPSVAQLAQGKVKTSDLREIEIEDLLQRDPVPPKVNLMKANIENKSVMVTGAGGSIGAELSRQILSLQPKCLVLYELNEFALYEIEKNLLLQQPSAQKIITPILGSVTNPIQLDLVLKRFGVQTLFHAAAYKHVPMVEKNPCAGAFNNIIGTWHSAIAAKKNGVETFVLVSTDKAVRPTNTMGATKRVSELILQALNQVKSHRTRFVIVRFGNVLGSSGSVLPVFKMQIQSGGPVTVTDPRIIRYFMTIPEAAQLLIQAGAMGLGGDVFVLDMGEPVKILDMAKKMIHLSGLTIRDKNNPTGDIEISFSGLRPGEKLYEELLIGANVESTRNPRIMRANEHFLSFEVMEKFVHEISAVCDRNDSTLLRILLIRIVNEFSPGCENQDLLI